MGKYKGKLLETEEALDMVLDHIECLDSEEVGLSHVRGRILASDVTSDIDVSPFDNSSMDGYAVQAANLEQASPEHPVSLLIVAHEPAGTYIENPLLTGQAIKIMTGAPIPPGADAIVRVEDTESEDIASAVGTHVFFTKPARVGQDIRLHGEEATAGSVVMHAGERISAAGVGLFAATGNPTVSVYNKPNVGIIATGSELVDIDEAVAPGKIRNSNTHMLSALVQSTGGKARVLPKVDDVRESLRKSFLWAAARNDVVITTGGVSVGDYDYTKEILSAVGKVVFDRVSLKPGKPSTFGYICSKGRKVPFFGLPGNPAAAYVSFELFVRPALLKMQGFSQIERPGVWAKLTRDTKKPVNRKAFVRAIIERDRDAAPGQNLYHVTPAGNQSSALLGSAQKANCLMVLPVTDDRIAHEGEFVYCLLFDCNEGGL